MSAAASGGLLGMGAGRRRTLPQRCPAADTDLVFGMLCEEWGLLIARAWRWASIIALALFSPVRAARVGRSSFYTIAACAAGFYFTISRKSRTIAWIFLYSYRIYIYNFFSSIAFFSNFYY